MTIPLNPTYPIRKTTKMYTSKKGKFGYMPVKMVNQTMDKTEKKAYEKELARLNSKKSLNKYKTPKEKAAIKGAKIFLRRRIKSLSGKSRKKKRTRRRRKKSSGKSRTRK